MAGFGIVMLAAQFAFLFVLMTALLLPEGMFYYSVPEAALHAVERAPITAATTSIVLTGAHFVRVLRTPPITGASLRSVQRLTFDSAGASEHSDHIFESIRCMPGVRGLRPHRSDSWEIDLGAWVRWFARVTISVTGESIVLETAPRHPLLFPGRVPRMQKIDSLIAGVQSTLSRRT